MYSNSLYGREVETLPALFTEPLKHFDHFKSVLPQNRRALNIHINWKSSEPSVRAHMNKLMASIDTVWYYLTSRLQNTWHQRSSWSSYKQNMLGAKPHKIHILVGVPFTRKIPSNYHRVIYFEDWMLTFKLDILLVAKLITLQRWSETNLFIVSLEEHNWIQ